MIRILDKNKVPLCGFDDEFDLCIESTIEFGDRKLTLEADWALLRDYVQPEGYIATKTDRYVIKEIKRNSERECTIIAQLDLEALEGKTFVSFVSVEQTISDCLALAFAGTGWTVSASSVTKRRTIRMANASSLKIFEQALKTYRCEAVIDSINQTITITEQIGQDRGVYFVPDLNLRKLEVSETSYDFYTEIEPYGKNGMTIESVNDGVKYVENHTYSAKSKRLIWKDERYTVAESLKADAEAKLADMAKPYVSYSADVSDLAKQSGQYSVLQYGLGDIIILSDPITGTRETQRVVGLREYPKHPEDNACTLANRQLTFEELSSKYEDTAETVENVTSDNGTLKGDAVDEMSADKLTGLNTAVAGTQVVQSLQADSLQIGGELTAVTARVGTLEANTASFEVAVIERLEADEADINTLRTVDLSAATGRIQILESDYINVKSLLAGNAATGGLTAITLNSQNAVFDTAFLKTLLANNITVNDLKAGNIDTGQFTVGSADGTFKIEDSTLTVKDANDNVRIQLGLDAQGNYTLYIGNEYGTLINANGVQPNAIANELIVDRMVKDSDANYNGISASKLNINSVVGAINQTGGLRDSSIIFDETGQTLTQAYTQLESLVRDANDTSEAAYRDAMAAVEASQEAISALSGISVLDALAVSLSSDAQTVHTESDGTGGDYSQCFTTVSLYLGVSDVTANGSFVAVPSENVTGVWDPLTYTYRVTNLEGYNGFVDIYATYIAATDTLTDRDGNNIADRDGNRITARSGVRIKKRFVVSKAPDGEKGAAYLLSVNADIVKRHLDTSMLTPASLGVRAYRISDGITETYNGIFVISTSLDYETYTQSYRSAVPETYKSWTIPSDSVSVRVELYDATGIYLYARKDIPVIADADALQTALNQTQQSVLNLTTRVGGTETGIDGLRQTLSETQTIVNGLEAGSLISYGERTPNGDGTVTYRIKVFKKGLDATEDYADRCFSWYRQVGTDEVFIQSGNEISVDPEDFGYDSHLIGLFTELEAFEITDRDGNSIVDRNGNQITGDSEKG